MRPLQLVTRSTSSAGGQVLGAAARLVSVRPAPKPLHPRGTLVGGTLRRSGGGPRTGATWLDRAGEDEVVVRRSRAVGLPSPAPDIHGLAIRVPTGDGGYGDLLLATTGLGRLTRFTLTVARSPSARPYTTLLPYRTPLGPVLLSAVFRDEASVALAWATVSGVWHHVGDLTLHADPVREAGVRPSFDPVAHALPGLETYDWVRRLRQPAYVTARRSRRDAGPT